MPGRGKCLTSRRIGNPGSCLTGSDVLQDRQGWIVGIYPSPIDILGVRHRRGVNGSSTHFREKERGPFFDGKSPRLSGVAGVEAVVYAPEASLGGVPDRRRVLESFEFFICQASFSQVSMKGFKQAAALGAFGVAGALSSPREALWVSPHP